MEKEELREAINGILKDNHENPPTARRVKCGSCQMRQQKTLRCRIYPNGIPEDILEEKTICRSFRKKA